MSDLLHPNLARIASEYDKIWSAHTRGEITAQQARNHILSLVARDDNGVIWGIDPDTGLWFYRNKDNKKVTATPPSIGVKSYTPSELGSIGGKNIDDKIIHNEVDLLYSTQPYNLKNLTRKNYKYKNIFIATSIFILAVFITGYLFLQ